MPSQLAGRHLKERKEKKEMKNLRREENYYERGEMQFGFYKNGTLICPVGKPVLASLDQAEALGACIELGLRRTLGEKNPELDEFLRQEEVYFGYDFL